MKEHSKPEHMRTEAESGYMQTWAYVHCVAWNAELPVLFKFVYIFSFCESIWLNSYKLNACIMWLHCTHSNKLVAYTAKKLCENQQTA